MGKPTAFDVTIVSPCRKDLVSRTTNNPNLCLNKAFDDKNHKFLSKCSDVGRGFVPLVVSTLGAWHPVSIKHIKEMAKLEASSLCRLGSVQTKRVLQRLGIIIQKGNAALLIPRSPNIRDNET